MKESLKKILYKAKITKDDKKSNLYKNNYYSIQKKNNLYKYPEKIREKSKNKSKSKKISQYHINGRKKNPLYKSSLSKSKSKSKTINKDKRQISLDSKILYKKNRFNNSQGENSSKRSILNKNPIPKPEPYPSRVIKKKEKIIRYSSIQKKKVNPKKSVKKKKIKITSSKSFKKKYNSKSKSKLKKSFLNKKKITSRSNSKKSKSKKSNSKKSDKQRRSISPQTLNKKLHQRSLIAQNSFKLNLQDIIKVDEIYNLIINTKPEQNSGFNFEILKEFFINNYCFILKDLNVLFYKLDFRNKMRKFFLKEITFFTYLVLLLIQTQMESSLLVNHRIENKNSGSNFSDRYYENVNREIYELLIQIISNLHVVFILRIEIFLDRAAMYYQNHKLFKKIKLILSKRKSNYKINVNNKEENFQVHTKKIERYLDLTEQALEEVFKLNNNFINLSHSLFESLLQIVRRKGEIKISEYNKLLKSLKIKFDSKGLTIFDIQNLSSLIYNQQNSAKTKTIETSEKEFLVPIPFLKSEIRDKKKYTLILDLDETIIYYPDEKIDVFNDEMNDHIKIRPFSLDFLNQLSFYYEIIVFTAASQHYADKILDFLDPNGLINYRFYRQHLTDHQGKYVKDISKIGRNLNSMVILDNTPENFVLQPNNGVFIKSWRGEMKDKCLLWLTSIFMNIAKSGTEDIREVLVELKNLLLSNYS